MTTYKQIYKLLDDSWLINKELSFGCECIWDGTQLIFTWEYWKPSMDWNDELIFLRWKVCQTILKNKIKVIWHPPTILDILRWFNKSSISVKLSDNWLLSYDYEDYWECIICNFDIKSLLLKDQSPETLEKLYELMESITN